MQHIKTLRLKYHFIQRDEEVFLTAHNDGDNLLSLLMEDLEEKIISFTDELESRLNDMYESIQSKCSDLFNTVSKMPNKESLEHTLLFDTLDRLTDIRVESVNSLKKILDYTDESLDEVFDDDISFLKFSSVMAKDLGDIQEAVKIQELTRKRLFQLSDLVHDLCRNTEDKINSQMFSILELLDHKYSLFSFLSESESEIDEVISDSYSNEDDIQTSTSVRIPRTSLELKRHLKKEGFELHRHNGSHNIYKNDKGEVRLLPARRGNHVLAAKTAKKIYQGVVNG